MWNPVNLHLVASLKSEISYNCSAAFKPGNLHWYTTVN